MFAARSVSKKLLLSTAAARRTMSTTKVAVLGAGGGIGQPLSMLLKLSPEIDELACYDIVGTPGVAADLSHVSFAAAFQRGNCHCCSGGLCVGVGVGRSKTRGSNASKRSVGAAGNWDLKNEVLFRSTPMLPAGLRNSN